MRNQLLSGTTRWLVAGILAAVAAFWAVTPAAAGPARLNRISDMLVEITGDGWGMRYGTQSPFKTQFVQADGAQAWFSHGRWLRLIDTKKGVVIGRWHFPGEILSLTPAGSTVQVEIETNEGGDLVDRRTLAFDPRAPKIPYWPAGSLYLYNVAPYEVGAALRAAAAGAAAVYRSPTVPFLGGFGWLQKASAEQAKQVIPGLEEAIRRDPLSPWFRIALGRALRVLGDPRADAAFEEALRVAHPHFAELFQLSSTLERFGEARFARAAFERGYEDFIRKGNDPRLFTALIGRLILYRPTPDWKQVPAEHRTELVERFFHLAPYVEAGELAWKAYADYLEKNGQFEEARTWRARAAEASANSTFTLWPGLGTIVDYAILIILGSFLAGALYILVLYRRYQPQRRLATAQQRPAGWGRLFSLFNAGYWSRRERIAFLAIVLVGWYAAGVASEIMHGIYRVAATSIGFGMGSFAGPINIKYISTRLPERPEQRLLLAMAHQQSGDNETAERLYRSLPEFPESWNNLGVILKETAREEEARQAFERALQLDPGLAEAALNLGRPPQSLWTEIHQKYLLNRPMLAPPKRERVLHAYLDGTWRTVALRAVGGPFHRRQAEMLSELGVGPAPIVILRVLLILGVAFSLALLFVIPLSEVTQPPGRRHWLWETLAPGTSPLWGFVGGLVLMGWCYFVVQILLSLKYHTPFITAAIATPNLTKSFGIPLDPGDLWRLLNPSWVWLYAAPAVLFVVNFVLVWHSRERAA